MASMQDRGLQGLAGDVYKVASAVGDIKNVVAARLREYHGKSRVKILHEPTFSLKVCDPKHGERTLVIHTVSSKSPQDVEPVLRKALVQAGIQPA